MSRFTSTERLTRLLAIIPWVVEQEQVTLDEVAERFGYPRERLVNDLQDVVPFVGVYPFTPDALVEVELDDDTVSIRYADWFSQPLRLPADKGLALLAAGQSMLEISGEDEDGPLLRALTKVGTAIGVDAHGAIDVRIGAASEQILATLRTAVAENREVELDYYVFSRDERVTRTIEPHRLHADLGQWYVDSFCQLARAPRVFRVDRIRSATLRDGTFTAPDTAGAPTVFNAAADVARVVLEIDASARWVADTYPYDRLEDLDDGAFRLTLAVTGDPWLERLLLRLGPAARVVGGDARFGGTFTADAAARVLARYPR